MKSLLICLGYRYAGCLQLASHQRCADCGPICESNCHQRGGGGILSRLSQGDDMFLQKLLLMFKVAKTATKLKSG